MSMVAWASVGRCAPPVAQWSAITCPALPWTLYMAEPPVPPPEKIDTIFRGGSITAIGVVLAFSLAFLNNWASQDGPWTRYDIVAVVFVAVGIACQIRTLAGMLSLTSLQIPTYNRLIRIFLIGLSLMSVGLLLALFGDIVGSGLAALAP
jgi:hypothetical protein